MIANELAARWRTEGGERLTREIFQRLPRGERLDELGLGQHDGRFDLRGIAAPTPESRDSRRRQGWVVQELSGLLRFQRVKLMDLDLTGAKLQSLRFFHTTISNCRFDKADCRDWRLWAVDVTDSVFVKADLRKAVLGAWYEGRGDLFRRVNFSGANMRAIVSAAATFVDCDFGDAQLARVDFQSSSFIRCRFAGLLREVMFYDHGFRTGKPDPNPMEDVDFSDAVLRMVEFRRLNLDKVRFPTSSDHVVISHFRCVLEQGLRDLGNVRDVREDPMRARLRVLLEHELKWAGSRQEKGVFNRHDLAEMGGHDYAEFATRFLRRLEADCAR